MEHSLAPALDSARPWRTATIVASAVAAVELVVLVVVGIGFLAKPVANHVRTAATERVLAPAKSERAKPKSKAAAAVTLPQLSRSRTSILVLNGTGLSGAAAQAAARLRVFGYAVAGVGNAPRSDYARSVVMYRAGFKGEAQRLARDLHLRIVGPLDGLRVKELMGAHIAVVLGSRH